MSQAVQQFTELVRQAGSRFGEWTYYRCVKCGGEEAER